MPISVTDAELNQKMKLGGYLISEIREKFEREPHCQAGGSVPKQHEDGTWTYGRYIYERQGRTSLPDPELSAHPIGKMRDFLLAHNIPCGVEVSYDPPATHYDEVGNPKPKGATFMLMLTINAKEAKLADMQALEAKMNAEMISYRYQSLGEHFDAAHRRMVLEELATTFGLKAVIQAKPGFRREEENTGYGSPG